MLASGARVAVLGGAGGIGQTLSLLLKISPEVADLRLYDVTNSPGVAADLSSLPTKAKVSASLPSSLSWPPKADDGLRSVLSGVDVVVISAGIPPRIERNPEDLFLANCGIVKSLAHACRCT